MKRARTNITQPVNPFFLELMKHPDQIQAERCRRSLFYTMKTFWHVMDPATDPVWNWHIPYLCEELETIACRVGNKQPKEYDLIINIPPGTTKSITVNVVFPIWCWLNWYWMRFICVSYSAALSLELAEKSRDIVKSSKFGQLFPELEIKRDTNAKGNFKIEKHVGNEVFPGGNRYSTSVGGTVTGFHAHFILVDDPLDPKQAASETELKGAGTWLDSTLPTRKVDKKITPTITIMQRLNQKDPTGSELAKQRTNLKHICLPGEIREYGEYLNPPELKKEYVDGLLDPIRMPWSVLGELKTALGQYGYAGQIGQNPVPPGGGMFKVERFNMMIVFPGYTNITASVRYWDKAGTDDAGSWTVGVLMHRFVNGRYLISDVRRGQWSSEIREAVIKDTAEADDVRVMVYHEQEPGSGGKDSARATTKNLAGFSAHADRPVGNKIFRADPWSVQVNEGNVSLMQGEWNHLFKEEHRFFPFGTDKDQVDGSSGAFSKLTAKRTVRSLLKTGKR